MNVRRDTVPYYSITITMGVISLGAVIGYLYFLNVSVVEVVMRKDAIRQAAALSADIALLEAAYIDAQHTIAERIGNESALSFDAHKVFVTRGEADVVVLAP
jgi:hypothetical protein